MSIPLYPTHEHSGSQFTNGTKWHMGIDHVTRHFDDKTTIIPVFCKKQEQTPKDKTMMDAGPGNAVGTCEQYGAENRVWYVTVE